MDVKTPPPFQIFRDSRYRATLRRDTARQHLRRLVHRLACPYERWVWWPRWQRPSGTRKTLSVCIMTLNAEDRIRPLLAYLRPLADELVVGVDSKTTDHTFAACEGFADELFTIKNDAQTCNAGLETLISRCHGDWVLRLDDDEFPEPRFTRLKDGLIASQHYTHYKLPRLHLAAVAPPSLQASHRLTWINDGYLYPDFQMRLFRNDRSLLSFPGAVGHSSIHCQGPRGKVNTVNLVHLNLAMNARRKREEKLKRYIDRLNGGWVHPINEQALLFEDFDYRTEPYDDPDDSAFCTLLAETILAQRKAHEAGS